MSLTDAVWMMCAVVTCVFALRGADATCKDQRFYNGRTGWPTWKSMLVCLVMLVSWCGMVGLR